MPVSKIPRDHLQTYQAVRLPRAVVACSRRVGALIQRTDHLTCWTRNLLIRLLPASPRLKALEPFIKDAV